MSAATLHEGHNGIYLQGQCTMLNMRHAIARPRMT